MLRFEKFNVVVNDALVFGAICEKACVDFIAKNYWDEHPYKEKGKRLEIAYGLDEIYICDEIGTELVELNAVIEKAVQKRRQEAKDFTTYINKYGVDFLGSRKSYEEHEEEDLEEEDNLEEDFNGEISEDKVNVRFIDMNDMEDDFEINFATDMKYTEDDDLDTTEYNLQ